jgi:hypothetical protein
VPYPFAHPVAVLPLVQPMGRFAVPSALVIGSVVPDLWYFVPFVSRADSHGAAGLFWFCLPAGLAAYVMFHLLLKEPLIALLSPRLGSFTCAGLPAVPWHAVVVSLLVGAITHLLWDGATHSNDHAHHGHNWLQHVNTALGTAILAWWIWRKLSRAPAAEPAVALSPLARSCTIAALLAAMAAAGYGSAADAGPWLSFDLLTLKRLLRSAGMAAIQGLCLALFAYCLLWHFRANRSTSA